MPAGIEFECPHCHRVTKVPLSLAGKQGRCAGCRKVLEVPAAPPPGAGGGRTPDPEDGLLEVLDGKRASDRLAATKRASDRVAPAARKSERVEPPAPPEGSPGEDEGSTTKLPPPGPPPAVRDFGAWARKVPPRVWFGFPLAILFPAIGIALCVLGLKSARERGAGVRMAWAGIGIGGTIMALNLLYMLLVVMRRSG